MAIRENADQIDAPIVDDNDDDTANAFLKTMLTDADDEDQPSGSEEDKPKKKRPAADEDDDKPSDESPDDEAADDADGEDADEDADDDDKKRKYADDDDETYVKVTVNGKDEEVSVKSLKRLYGQEKALTQKSQEVAEHRKALETETEKNTLASNAIFERAKLRWEPYSQIDFNLAAKELTADEYTALRSAAQTAWEDVQFLSTHLDAFHGTIRERQHTDLVARAKKGLEVLTGDPEKGGIDGFNEKVYNDVREYASKEGFTPDTINNLVDANAIRVMHKAMLYDRGRTKSASKTIVTKVNKTPKKVVKTSSAPDRTHTSTKNTAAIAKATAKLRQTGSIDDAADAFMALAGVKSDD